jgi:hypothetical protein
LHIRVVSLEGVVKLDMTVDLPDPMARAIYWVVRNQQSTVVPRDLSRCIDEARRERAADVEVRAKYRCVVG